MSLLLLIATNANAATLKVGGSGAYSTIQSAVNAASSGDTIQIAAGTYNEDVDTKGKDLSLIGAGSAKVTINASGNDSAITVDQGESVYLEGVTLTGSDQGVNVVASTFEGADIEIYGMTGDSAGGGFLISKGAAVDVSDCLVRGISVGNSAYGGAVFLSESTASFSSCTFKNNDSYQGGGLYVTASTIELTDCIIKGNSSTLKGGGLQLRQGSDATLLRTEVSANESDDQGGGVNIEDSDLSCQNCSVLDNIAGSSGGGVAVDGALSAGTTFSGKNSVISGNQSVGAGGGLYVWDAKLTLSGELSDNSISGDGKGAGLYYGKAKLTLTDLDVSGHSAGDGGAIFVSSTATKVVASGGTWSDNSSSSDGGVLYSGAPLELTDTVVQNNSAVGAGGGVFVDSQTTTVDGATFTGNSAGKDGGGLKVYKAEATVKTSSFLGNTAPIGAGYYHHAVSVGSSKATVISCTFDGNSASTRGGGLSIESASAAKVTLSTFKGNSSDGLYISGTSTPVLLDDNFKSNVGSGLVLDNTTGGRGERLKAQGNSGVGATLGSTKNFTLYNSVFDGNGDTGLEILAPSAGNSIQNSDLVDNGGHGLEVLSGSDIEVLNCIAAYNVDDGFGGSNNGGAVTYSDAYGNGGSNFASVFSGGTGQLTKDPQYTGFSDDGNPNNNILFLGSSSPCRDKGDPSISDTDGSRSDMGAFGGPEASDKDSDGDGYKPSDGDCDESDASVYPGAPETWYDGIDSDCAGDDDFDRDGDGYRHEDSGVAASKVDCNDRDKSVHPGAEDVPGDGVDSDCDGADGEDTGGPDDTGDTGSGPGDDTGEPGWWVDADGDGYAPSQGDCNDAEIGVSPGVDEVCDDGVDNDCDGDIDKYDAACFGDASCGGCNGGAAGGAMWVFSLLLLGIGRRRRD